MSYPERPLQAELNNEKFSVRALNHQALPEIMRIENAAHIAPWSEAIMRDSLAGKYRALGLYQEACLSAFAITMDVVDECHLLNICVAPERQGKGVGRVLLRELIQQAAQRKCAYIYLEVRVSNESAIGLYHSEGFNEVGVRPNYYPGKTKREDALLMTLDLQIDALA